MASNRIIIRHTATGTTLTASGETVNITGMDYAQRRTVSAWISDSLGLTDSPRRSKRRPHHLHRQGNLT